MAQSGDQRYQPMPCGRGVALNSVLNGWACWELWFDRTFVSPYPGDDGIAVGCCAAGLFGRGLFGDDANGAAHQQRGEGARGLPPVHAQCAGGALPGVVRVGEDVSPYMLSTVRRGECRATGAVVLERPDVVSFFSPPGP